MRIVRERDAAALDPALVKLALVVVVGVIAAILDLTMVNVALDTLQQQLHASVSTIQWVSTGYSLAVASTIPLSGWAFERLGARRSWLLALLVFVVASALCATAWSAGSLIVFRVRGIGLGMALVPTTSAMYQGLPPAAVPPATTGIRIFQQVGGALGTAVLAVILGRTHRSP